jgi:peptidoglycan/LPS O-acetylase OafA/YrhL
MLEVSTLDTGSSKAKNQSIGARESYLPFINGLRALSIFVVVFCHIGLPGFSGGYIGVDIFFVISGFLIINQIKNQLEAESFSLSAFYARRALRIIPAFLIMLLPVALIAQFILPTPDLASDFINEVISAALMVSNVLFYARQDYFDISSQDKPLLHTWSLSVEEQFYWFAPVAILLLFYLRGRRFDRTVLGIAVSVALVSFAGCVIHTYGDERSSAFYLTYWRIWEFIAGGLIRFPLQKPSSLLPRYVPETMAWIGLAAIIFAVGWFDKATLYPSWRALLPVFGAVSIISVGLTRPEMLLTRFLACRVMVGVGLVSYAWYLWHWPVLTLMNMSELVQKSLVGDILCGGVFAFLMACGSYYFVEKPIYDWKSNSTWSPQIVLRRGIAACLIVAVAGGLLSFSGYVRIKSFINSYYQIDGRGRHDNGCRIWRSASIPSQCVSENLAMLMGDSRAEALFDGMARNFDDLQRKLILMGWGGCSPLMFAPSQREVSLQNPRCERLLAPFAKLMSASSPVVSVLMTPSEFIPNSIALWSELISQFDPSKVRVLLIYYPEFSGEGLECILLSDRYGKSRDRCNHPRPPDAVPEAFKVLARNNPNVRYVDATDAFCDAHECHQYKGNQVFYKDGTHLFASGADRIFDRFESDFRWAAWLGKK